MGTWGPSGGPDERADESRVGGGKRLILPDPAPVGLALIEKTTRAEKLVNEIEEFVDDVVFLHDGEIALQGNADALRNDRGASLSQMFEEVLS